MRPIAMMTLLCAIPTSFATSAEPNQASSIGRTVAPFTLKDANDKAWSLRDAEKGRAVVVLFLGTECPINNAYLPRLADLHRDYSLKGVAFVGINSNMHDTPSRLAGFVKEYQVPFPLLKDTANVVADLFGARRTPEAFVLTPKGTIVYQGRIDDQFGIGYKRNAPTRRDLVEAIEDVLNGKEVRVPTTPLAGCLIARTIKPAREGSITYTKHVSRVIQNHCQECHRSGEVAPFPLQTYEDALAWQAMIKEVVEERRMPPWHADPKHGPFANDRSLSKQEQATILAWIAQGCPRGDDADLPPPRSFPKDWRIGKPDVVFSMPREFTVPATAGPNGIKYQHFIVPTNFDQDMWVQAAEARPGNRAVVHHILVYVVNRGQRLGDRSDGIGNGMLVAYAPGDMPFLYPEGYGKKIPKGATLVFQMHYTPNGVEQNDRSSLGLIFSKQPPKHEVRTRAIAQRALFIWPNAANHQATSTSTFDRDAEIVSLMPHMHLRGKDFEYRVTYPDGKKEVLLAIHWDFNWQSTYRFKEPLKLPAGSKIECVAHFDNSAGNPNNPDPTKFVRWGDQTWEEMMIGFVDYYYTDPAKAKP